MAQRLWILTWGTRETDTSEGTPALFELPGMQTNLCSKNNPNLCPGDGSFNLASTHGEGEGYGVFLPAVQTATPEARARINEVLQVLHKLYRLIMPCCVSKWEWEMMEFNAIDNNVMAFGGLDPGPPACQFNSVSTLNSQSTDKDLSESIGVQGKPHEDDKDDPAGLTLVTILVKLAKGNDPGLFLCGRPGVYIRELDVWIFWTAFKGKDAHCGVAPTADPAAQAAFLAYAQANEIRKATPPQCRVAFVKYPSNSGDTRNTHFAVSPPLHFGNTGAPITHHQNRMTFTADGAVILGDERARSNRLGCEAFFILKNILAYSKLVLNLDVNELLQNTIYSDENGNTHSLEPISHNIEDDKAWAQICLYRRYYCYYKNLTADTATHLSNPTHAKSCQNGRHNFENIRHTQKERHESENIQHMDTSFTKSDTLQWDLSQHPRQTVS
ncbi:hypothetical protein B0H10DRAFT_1965124 [Mycena sp. CBHHK59/15]|nr:hypothetical protein B0H10DRAFT_1965124 [Mycena sp. CBHHK59/15]